MRLLLDGAPFPAAGKGAPDFVANSRSGQQVAQNDGLPNLS